MFLRRLVFVGRRQHFDELLERLEIFLLDRSLDRFFDPMVAWYEGWIDQAHVAPKRCRRSIFAAKAAAPTHGPFIESHWVFKEAAHPVIVFRGRIDQVAEAAKREREVRRVLRHPSE